MQLPGWIYKESRLMSKDSVHLVPRVLVFGQLHHAINILDGSTKVQRRAKFSTLVPFTDSTCWSYDTNKATGNQLIEVSFNTSSIHPSNSLIMSELGYNEDEINKNMDRDIEIMDRPWEEIERNYCSPD